MQVWDLNEMLVITRCIPQNMNRLKGSSVFIDPDSKELANNRNRNFWVERRFYTGLPDHEQKPVPSEVGDS